MASEYSDKEVALFQALGLGHLVPHLSPAPFYRLAMEKAFVEGWSGPAVYIGSREVQSFRSIGR